MDTTKLGCSINDTTNLRGLILENPGLPVLIFCGEDAWHGEYPYEAQTNVRGGEIKELTLYKDWWLDKDDYENSLADDLYGKEGYKDLSDEEYSQIINKKVAETEFVKAIVIYVG